MVHSQSDTILSLCKLFFLPPSELSVRINRHKTLFSRSLIVIPTIKDSLIPPRDASKEGIHPDGGAGGEADILFWFNQRSNMHRT